MASTSSMASSSLDKPSTSAPNEIEEVEENTRPIQNSVPEKSKEARANILNVIYMDLESMMRMLEIKKHEETVKEANTKCADLKNNYFVDVKHLREVKNLIKALKKKILTQGKDNPEEGKKLFKKLDSISIANAQAEIAMQEGKMPNLFIDSDFERTLQFRDFEAQYNELPLELKLCLLCFSVFPEDVEIKRRVMVFWWIGEGFVPPRKDRPEERTNQQHWDKFDLTKNNPPKGDLTPEHWANFYFSILLKMGFIESAQKKPNPKVNTYKMDPFIRIMVSRIAQKAEFLEFDDDGIVNEEFSKSLRACLLAGEILGVKDNKISEKKNYLEKSKEKKNYLKSKEKIHAIFNVNFHAILNVDEVILDSKHNYLSNMKNANVLYLGRWQNISAHDIELEDTEILKAKRVKILDGLQNITNLKFLSFQGISRINELPKSVLKLKNLTILDIRACHNLDKIPNDIQCLVNLTHLDMTGCYLLDEMPKGISKLKKLQVLSGFVVAEPENKKSCTLDDLKEFPYLRKLSIYKVSDNFPSNKDLQALNQFKALSKLTIVWGRGSADKANLVDEQTPNKENQEKNTDEADKVTAQDNDQRPEQDNKEDEMNEKKILQMSQESQKRDKGKGILQGLTREIVKVPEPVIDKASTSSNQEDHVPEKEKEKEKEKSKGYGLGLSRKKGKPELPSHLTKLDLQGVPEKPLNWLKPKKLSNLKKLYIRGGKLSDLGQIQDFADIRLVKPKWEQVEELRLKNLDELEMEWRELLELFPKLDYLEKVHCPKLSFFPCDELGVWTKKKIFL